MMGFLDGSGISWTICKQSAPHSRQMTTPTPHHSIFTGWMLFLMPNQQCRSTASTVIFMGRMNVTAAITTDQAAGSWCLVCT